MIRYPAKCLAFVAICSIIITVLGCGKELLPPTDNNNNTIAGSGLPGAANGTGTAATFNGPFGIAIGANGSIYVADLGNQLIRKITTGAIVTTLAGSADSAGYFNAQDTLALFNKPFGVAVDASGNVYVADAANNVIRKVTPGGLVSTYAGTGAAGASNGTDTATFNFPEGVAIDNTGNLYVADYGNDMIRKISAAGVVSTLAGSGSAGSVNGVGVKASFSAPGSLAVDASGNVYVTDNSNNLVRKVTPDGTVSTLAGSGNVGHDNGAGTTASFSSPFGIAVDATGNVYVADAGNNMIRKITPTGLVSTLAGGKLGAANGSGSNASFNTPAGLAVDATGNIYIADENNNTIRMLTPAGTVTTLATINRPRLRSTKLSK